MKQEWINMMKSRKRLKLTFGQTITHYMVVPFLLFIPGLMAKSLFEIFVTENYSGVRSAGELLTASIPFLVLAIAFAYIQYRRLDLKEIKVNYTDDQFQEAVRRTVENLNLRIENNQRDFFRAHRSSNWTGSWGEMITIVKDKERLLINSICDPDRLSSVVSYGWNRRNLRTFLTNLTETIKQAPVRQLANEKNIKTR